MAKEVAAKKDETTALTTFDESVFDNAPSGMENVTSADLKIPRILILQSTSNQIKKTQPEYIEGAQIGDFCDVSTAKVFKDSVLLLPCYYAKVYIEWYPRDSGKGIAANHGMTLPKGATRNDKMQHFAANGNLIEDTMTFYCLNLSDNWRRCFVPLKGTQIKNGKNWLTAINAERRKTKSGEEVPVPIFWRAWKAEVKAESNNSGDWLGWRFSPDQRLLDMGPAAAQLLKEATAYCNDAPTLIPDLASLGEDEKPSVNSDEEVM